MKVIILVGVLAALQSIQCKPIISSNGRYADFQQGDNGIGNILKLVSCVLPKVFDSGDTIDTGTAKNSFDMNKLFSAIFQCSSSLTDVLSGLSPKENVFNNLVARKLAQELENEEVAQEEEADQEIAEEQFFKEMLPKILEIFVNKFAEKFANEG